MSDDLREAVARLEGTVLNEFGWVRGKLSDIQERQEKDADWRQRVENRLTTLETTQTRTDTSTARRTGVIANVLAAIAVVASIVANFANWGGGTPHGKP